MRDFANLQVDSWLQRRGAEVCLAFGFSPAFVLLRPDAFDEQTILVRLGCWGGLLACWFMAMAMVEALLSDQRFFQDLSPRARRALVIGLAAFPMVVIAAAINVLSGWQASVYEVSELYAEVLVLGSVAALFAKTILEWRADTALIDASPLAPMPAGAPVMAAPQAPAAPPVAVSPLAARLLLNVRGRILCLEMEDHYVRVHTDQGSALVLMRLSDAITEAHPVQGRQVHRSWWVSDAAVESFERNGRTGAVRLSNGARVPVSQRYLKSVEDSFA